MDPIAVFGQSELGQYHKAYFCNSIYQLVDTFGNPPENSLGLTLAMQALMFETKVIFFRVEEEGFSDMDYIKGFEILKNPNEIKKISAICLPNVGDHKIIDRTDLICKIHRCLLITTDKDLFDYFYSY